MVRHLLAKYKSSGVLLDTNLFVLFLVGSYNSTFVPNFKRTSMYTANDFYWLEEYVKEFSKIIITPHILAEAWNLLEKMDQSNFRAFLNKTMQIITVFQEEYVSKNTILESEGFAYIGVTDMSVIRAASKLNCLVLTDDLRAYSFFVRHDVETLNINHLRQI